ncbi:MAG: hypothetical protein JW867_00305 [Candidatus Omnitrophica bacterium]|nr:hypothetical protein [Candidatus Omnitrophota bacterium]
MDAVNFIIVLFIIIIIFCLWKYKENLQKIRDYRSDTDDADRYFAVSESLQKKIESYKKKEVGSEGKK